MRAFEFPITFTQRVAKGVAVKVHVGPSHTAREFVSDEFITPGVTAFLRLLAMSKGSENAFAVTAADERILCFEISDILADRAWTIAAILNLIDSATFLQDIDDDPFITSVTVEIGHLPGVTLESAFADMDAHAGVCAMELSPLLKGGFMVEGEIQRDWPRDAPEYFFDIGIALSPALDPDAIAAVKDAFASVEITLAGSAFEMEKTPEELLDDGLIPFPVSAEVLPGSITYAIESPPSDISIPLVLLHDALVRTFKVRVADWNVKIRERW